ncbi:T6SS effector BTH_I2691 family protein [Burkholderia metallica]|uniref:T6SS effector BTH_I2691 family protein n=1 Tax=Burkholderia metallica TaxID=488729 RepID=A0ABT8PCA1_9BURK|nr:T6SS effector BTH_I2691 family protein [Burkholderia metallica]MDN7932758.1 T6SS effector BTH_I2691 family protein [Burkholderia metallica]
MAAATEPKCDLCDKHGLLLMPVRYAVAPVSNGLPAVSAPLKVEDAARSVGNGKPQNLTMQGGSARYTARLLRSGYLYVYDEKRDRMDAYWITEDGNYLRIAPEAAVPDGARSARPCNFTGHRELAGCIAIPDARDAGIVWLGYSDVQWTQAVIDAHKGANGKRLRELHMRAFDAGAWANAHPGMTGKSASRGRGAVPHAVPMSELATTVGEYATAKSVPNGFAPSSAPRFHLHAGKADEVLAACSRRSPELLGAIVAVDDPAGVAQDLAALINWHKERLNDTRVEKERYGAGYGPYPTTYRDLVALDAAIKTLHASNDVKVKREVFQQADDLADYLKVSYEVAREHGRAMGSVPPRNPAREQELDALIRHPSPERWENAQQKSWNAFLDKLNVDAYGKWKTEYEQAEKTLQTQHIEPLAKAHAVWMQSNQLANKLDCTHDGKDALAGDVYAETLQRCMAATQEIAGCSEVYVRWLKGAITEKTNLLLRALVLRQDDLIEALAAAPLDPEAVPWKALMDRYAQRCQALIKSDPVAQAKARMKQAAADKARAQAEAARRELSFAAAMSSGVALFDNPLRRAVEQKEAAAKSSQAQAEQAKQEAAPKLLPDSVANVLTQIARPLAAVLREFNENAAEKTLARWMAVVGVALKMPAGTVEINGTARDTIKTLSKLFIDNLVDTGEQAGKPLSAQQVRQLTTLAERQVVGSFASGNLASFEARARDGNVKARMVVFINDDIREALKATSDPTLRVKLLAEKVTSPGSLREFRLLRAKLGASVYGAATEGALTAIDAVCKYAGWKALLESERKALSFQKTRQQDWRETLGGALFVGALGTGVGNVAKTYGTWRNQYATGMAERMAGREVAKRADIALRVVGVVAAAVSGVVAVMDFVDAKQNLTPEKWQLSALQIISGTVGGVSAILSGWAAFAAAGGATTFLGLSLTGWGLVLAVALVAIGLVIDHVKGNVFSQWLEKTYWGASPVGSRYGDSKVELADFSKAMAEA